MKVYMTPAYRNFYEALASDTRLTILQLLCDRDRNIKELAEEIGVSSSIITKHIRKLEDAKIIATNTVSRNGSAQKICSILNITYEIKIPFKNNRGDCRTFHSVNMPVGQFSGVMAVPPCGLLSETGIIGDLDEPKHLLDPQRVTAQMVWIGEGYLEYQFPNYLQKKQRLTGIEISGEYGSESAGYKDDWPSRIRVSLNGVPLCTITTPGDFGETRGLLTPRWWNTNQYGILMIIKVSEDGVYVNGERKSSVGLDQFDPDCFKWTLRYDVGHMSKEGGGFTIYGEKFGNNPQGIVFKQFYEQE